MALRAIRLQRLFPNQALQLYGNGAGQAYAPILNDLVKEHGIWKAV